MAAACIMRAGTNASRGIECLKIKDSRAESLSKPRRSSPPPQPLHRQCPRPPGQLSRQQLPTQSNRRGSVFPYGAVYFRKSNPPEEDWARDHETAARVGMNIFRHWFMWSAIEVAPGKYDWADYDRMMDLAAKNHIKVVIAEQVSAAPEWAFRKFANARYLASDGTVANSVISESSATGGFPGLCLDNADVARGGGVVSHHARRALPQSSGALRL